MGVNVLKFQIETKQEDDGRWIAEVIGMPGVLAYCKTIEDAIARVQSPALRVIADRIEHDVARPALLSIFFAAAPA